MSKFNDKSTEVTSREEFKRNEKSDIAQREEEILSFWNKHSIFEKTLQKESPKGDFVFYDGPPFATGLPHYGHILPGTIKDLIPRYKTMQGYHVARKWGWDCHGLPLENQVEKHLGLQNKLDIEKFGIDKFNEIAKNFVLTYAGDWEETIPRTGRFVDMKNDYRTMDSSYTESIWWAFKTLYDKGLAYEGFKAMHICPRCQTPLSNFEVNQGYTDVKDFAVTVRFERYNEPGTYFLAWTTTPWTLPGNMALAVNPHILYVKVKISSEDIDEYVILARERTEEVLSGKTFEIVEELQGSTLIGESYIPVFNYYIDKNISGKEHAWKIYGGDFVTTEDGTGLVHIAPAFGSDDLDLARKNGIPLVHHVTMDGHFTTEVVDFAGMEVKPKSGPGSDPGEKLDHTATDVEIIKWLAHQGKLFAKEKITHSYPLCWRCDTPLLNYATNSWFIEVTKIKDKLVEENKKVHWVPDAVGQARFGDWLEGARDWAISRLRYWGAPLPVWKSESGDYIEVLGSLEDLGSKVKSTNTYYMMRHGEAQHNLINTLSSKSSHHLTDKGIEEVKAHAHECGPIDLIFTSPLHRTRETARLVAEELGIKQECIIEDERLREVDLGVFEGKTLDEYHEYFGTLEELLSKEVDGGESFMDVKRRMGEFLYSIEAQYEGKRILIISHAGPLWTLQAAALGYDKKKTCALRNGFNEYMHTGEVRVLEFTPLPHNKDFELDFHRPYIDEITWKAPDGSLMRRIPDVFDCWFESGSMPYASNHYPFNTKDFNPEEDKWYPAHFIAEGLDQTRGWFYSLLVLGVSLFDRAPFKNVVVNGLVLAEDGKKMSKKLKNYPEVTYILDKYGADALRYYLINSPLVRAESINFSEKGVDEVVKKIIRKLENVVSFYEIYTKEHVSDMSLVHNSPNVLDQWIIARLGVLIAEVTRYLDTYELDKAARPFMEYVDDLSTWYLRRSRDRFKEKGEDAMYAASTTRFVMIEMLKILAPFMPFVTESLYKRLKGEKESIHLEDWPNSEVSNSILLEHMAQVRTIVSLGLEAREKAMIKVRQPLSLLEVSESIASFLDSEEQLKSLIRDEVNVKDVRVRKDLSDGVLLETTISEELRQEGIIRELIRFIQDMRKKEGLDPSDRIILFVDASKEMHTLIETFKRDITTVAGIVDIQYETVDSMQETGIDTLSVALKRV